MITSYATLQTEIANHLNRSDLTSVIPTLIQLAEDEFLNDEFGRVVKLTNRGTVTISGDGTTMPSDLYSIESWYHDGPTAYGPIYVVGSDAIGAQKAQFGSSGIPQFAAVVAGAARYAPVPDGTYSTKMTYWRLITRLSDTNTTNWLLEDLPSAYLYKALSKAEAYLKNDERLITWGAMAESLLNGYRLRQENAQFGGTLKRHHRPIGG